MRRAAPSGTVTTTTTQKSPDEFMMALNAKLEKIIGREGEEEVEAELKLHTESFGKRKQDELPSLLNQLQRDIEQSKVRPKINNDRLDVDGSLVLQGAKQKPTIVQRIESRIQAAINESFDSEKEGLFKSGLGEQTTVLPTTEPHLNPKDMWRNAVEIKRAEENPHYLEYKANPNAFRDGPIDIDPDVAQRVRSAPGYAQPDPTYTSEQYNKDRNIMIVRSIRTRAFNQNAFLKEQKRALKNDLEMHNEMTTLRRIIPPTSYFALSGRAGCQL